MLRKWMNSFFYGKSGKADYTPDDLPETRWQLFFEMLRIRFSGLVRLNMMYALVWLPAIIVLAMSFTSLTTSLGTPEELTASPSELIYSFAHSVSLLLIPCIAITGPFTAGVAYVTRNWARDEHAFAWADFKDAVKANWKQGLVVSLITAVLPFVVFSGWTYYSSLAAQSPFMIAPGALVLMLGLVWSLTVTYLYPLMVSYKLKMKDLIKNGLLLALGRLPVSAGMRLLHCVPLLIALLVATYWNMLYAVLGLCLYYAICGFGLSRFVTASVTNGVFDRFINSKIPGAVINRGLRTQTDDDDDEDDEDDSEIGA